MLDPTDERSDVSAEPAEEAEELEEEEPEEEPEEEETRAEEPEPKVEKTPPRVRRLDIVGRRNWFFLISLLIIIPGIISMSTRHFLLGIDFAGGTEFTVSFANHPSVTDVENAVSGMNIDGSVISTGSGGYLIRARLAWHPPAPGHPLSQCARWMARRIPVRWIGTRSAAA